MRIFSARSLWLRLILSLVGISLISILLATGLLYERFKLTNSQFRDRTLQNHARTISKFVRRLAPDAPIRLTDALIEPFQAENGQYAIIDTDGRILDASPGTRQPLIEISHKVQKDFFIYSPPNGGPTMYGVSMQSATAKGPIWVQVAFRDSPIVFDSVLEEFLEDIGWIWIPFVISILLVNLVVVRIGLRPLRRAAQLADAIRPSSEAVQLPEGGLPAEVLALVRAVNRAFERMRGALSSQRRFIADTAHELRTPVAVLKAHAAVLPDSAEMEALRDEINGLQRLIDQLLDSERLEGLSVEADQASDLNQLAFDLATQLGPLAIGTGRSIEIVRSDRPVLINGSYDFLYRAFRNLVENAIRFTPKGTAVVIKVERPGTISVMDHGPGVPKESRETIFRRFWQGRRDRAGGAGLGLDIVARTVAAHHGKIRIADAPDGGAVFMIELPPFTALRAGE